MKVGKPAAQNVSICSLPPSNLLSEKYATRRKKSELSELYCPIESVDDCIAKPSPKRKVDPKALSRRDVGSKRARQPGNESTEKSVSKSPKIWHKTSPGETKESSQRVGTPTSLRTPKLKDCETLSRTQSTDDMSENGEDDEDDNAEENDEDADDEDDEQEPQFSSPDMCKIHRIFASRYCTRSKALKSCNEKMLEYYVKFEHESYRHLQWLTRDELQARTNDQVDLKIAHFLRRMNGTGAELECPLPSQYEINFTLYAKIDRIIGVRISKRSGADQTREYYVKWQCLPYSQSTWEPEHGLQGEEDLAAIQHFNKVNTTFQFVPVEFPSDLQSMADFFKAQALAAKDLAQSSVAIDDEKRKSLGPGTTDFLSDRDEVQALRTVSSLQSYEASQAEKSLESPSLSTNFPMFSSKDDCDTANHEMRDNGSISDSSPSQSLADFSFKASGAKLGPPAIQGGLALAAEKPRPVSVTTTSVYGEDFRCHAAMYSAASNTYLWRRFLQTKLASDGAYIPSIERCPKTNKVVFARYLMAHQQEGIQWMFHNTENRKHGSLLADEMGLGKTCQSIAFVEHYLDVMSSIDKVGKHALIVVQKSLAETWRREFQAWAPHLNVVFLNANREDRYIAKKYERRWFNPTTGHVITNTKGIQKLIKADVLIVTYEGLRTQEFLDFCYLPNSKKQLRWACVIVDECQRVKAGRKSLLLQSLSSLNRDLMILLSGTPIQNTTEELFPMFTLLDPDQFHYGPSSKSEKTPNSWCAADFAARFSNIQERENCMQLTEELHKLMSSYILRREKVHVLKTIPTKSVKLIKIPLTLIQKHVYSMIYNRCISTKCLKFSNIHMQLRKCCIHPFLIDGMEELILRGKFDTLRDRLSAGPEDQQPVNAYSVSRAPFPPPLVKSVAHPPSESSYIQPLYPNHLAPGAPSAVVLGRNPGDSSESPSPLTPPARPEFSQGASSTVSSPSLHLDSVAMAKDHPSEVLGLQLRETGVDQHRHADKVKQYILETSGKLILLKKMLEAYYSEGRKVLIFSFFKSALDLVEDFIVLYKYPWLLERVDGQTACEERQLAIDRFNSDPKRFIFLCTTRAGGLGVNLTAASVVIHLDSDFNPQHDLQAQARCHRIGQVNNVDVFHFIAEHTYEDYMIYTIAGKKLGLEAVLLGRLDKSQRRQKLDKVQEELLLRKGIFAAIKDDKITRREADAFAKASIDEILSTKSTDVYFDPEQTASSGVPHIFSTGSDDAGGFEMSAPDLDGNDTRFWDTVAEKLHAHFLDEDKPQELQRADRRKGRYVNYKVSHSNTFGFLDSEVKPANDMRKRKPCRALASSSSQDDHDPDDDGLGTPLAKSDETQMPGSICDKYDPKLRGFECLPQGPFRGAPPAPDPPSALELKPEFLAGRGRKQLQPMTCCTNGLNSTLGSALSPIPPPPKPFSGEPSESPPTTDQSALCPNGSCLPYVSVSLPGEERKQPVSPPVSCAPDVYFFSPEEEHKLQDTEISQEALYTISVLELLYRCLRCLKRWRMTHVGGAENLKTEDICYADQIFPWIDSRKPHQLTEALQQTWFKIFEEWKQAGSDWNNLSIASIDVHAEDLLQTKRHYLERKWVQSEADVSLALHKKSQEQLIQQMNSFFFAEARRMALVLKTSQIVSQLNSICTKLASQVLVGKHFSRQFTAKKQTWIEAEDFCIKLIFIHFMSCRYSASTSPTDASLAPVATMRWPPPQFEINWSIVTEVIKRLNALTEGPERRRSAIHERFYNKLDMRWDHSDFTLEEQKILALAVFNNLSPALVAEGLPGRTLEKVKEGMRWLAAHKQAPKTGLPGEHDKKTNMYDLIEKFKHECKHQLQHEGLKGAEKDLLFAQRGAGQNDLQTRDCSISSSSSSSSPAGSSSMWSLISEAPPQQAGNATLPASCEDRFSVSSTPQNLMAHHLSLASPPCMEGTVCSRAPPRGFRPKEPEHPESEYLLKILLDCVYLVLSHMGIALTDFEAIKSSLMSQSLETMALFLKHLHLICHSRLAVYHSSTTNRETVQAVSKLHQTLKLCTEISSNPPPAPAPCSAKGCFDSAPEHPTSIHTGSSKPFCCNQSPLQSLQALGFSDSTEGRPAHFAAGQDGDSAITKKVSESKPAPLSQSETPLSKDPRPPASLKFVPIEPLTFSGFLPMQTQQPSQQQVSVKKQFSLLNTTMTNWAASDAPDPSLVPPPSIPVKSHANAIVQSCPPESTLMSSSSDRPDDDDDDTLHQPDLHQDQGGVTRPIQEMRHSFVSRKCGSLSTSRNESTTAFVADSALFQQVSQIDFLKLQKKLQTDSFFAAKIINHIAKIQEEMN